MDQQLNQIVESYKKVISILRHHGKYKMLEGKYYIRQSGKTVARIRMIYVDH